MRIGYPFQYSCLENPMDRGAWWTTVHQVEKSRIRLNLSTAHISENGLINSRAFLLVLRGNPPLKLLPKMFFLIYPTLSLNFISLPLDWLLTHTSLSLCQDPDSPVQGLPSACASQMPSSKESSTFRGSASRPQQAPDSQFLLIPLPAYC